MIECREYLSLYIYNIIYDELNFIAIIVNIIEIIDSFEKVKNELKGRSDPTSADELMKLPDTL